MKESSDACELRYLRYRSGWFLKTVLWSLTITNFERQYSKLEKIGDFSFGAFTAIECEAGDGIGGFFSLLASLCIMPIPH